LPGEQGAAGRKGVNIRWRAGTALSNSVPGPPSPPSPLLPPFLRALPCRVGNLFGESLYDIHSRLKGYPVLEPDMPPAARKNMIAAEIMSASPKVGQAGGREGGRAGWREGGRGGKYGDGR
jgi:hypothetical protein